MQFLHSLITMGAYSSTLGTPENALLSSMHRSQSTTSASRSTLPTRPHHQHQYKETVFESTLWLVLLFVSNSPIPLDDPCLELSYPGSRRRQSGA